MTLAESRLARLRETHFIQPVRAWSDNLNGFLQRCEFCGIRVHQEKDGRYKHSQAEIRALARGEDVEW